ncbi:MAG: hypothetical protein LBQ35_03005 [Spirochaetaceae bacterium]|nr:hypothetical protein [Spirochaetaceae bacterium]
MHIDLKTAPFYYRAGFDPGELNRVPGPAGGRWRRRERFPPGPLTVRDLEIPGAARRPFLSLRPSPEMEFTFLIPFSVEAGDRAGASTPGLYLAALGDNWAVYLNGRLLREEIHLDGSGAIALHRFLPGIALPLPGELILPGENILALRILGDPSGRHTGFFRGGAFYLGDYAAMLRQDRAPAEAAIGALLLFSALLFFCLYLSRKDEKQHLYYAAFACAFALYQLAETSLAYALIPDTALILRTGRAGLFMSLPLFIFYAESRIRSAEAPEKRIRLHAKLYFSFCLLLAALLFALPLSYEAEISLIWKCAALPLALFTAVYDFALPWAAALALREDGDLSKLEGALMELWESPPGNLLLFSAALLGAAVFDGLTAFVRGGRPFLTAAVCAASIPASALMLARRFVLLLRRLDARDRELAEAGEAAESLKAAAEERERQLEQKVRELSAAHTRIVVTEQQYQALFEEDRDPLAVLDGNLRFKRANPAAIKLYSLENVDIENRSTAIPTLADRLYRGAPDRAILIEQFWNSVYALKLNKAPVELEAFVETPEKRLDCTLRLAYRLSPDSGFEIFARSFIHESSAASAYRLDVSTSKDT